MERSRTANVNDAFGTLRNLIPTEPINRKLSKIETLRLATSYISHLQSVLATGLDPCDQPCLKNYLALKTSSDPMILNSVLTGKIPPGRPVCTFCASELKQLNKCTNSKCKPNQIKAKSTRTFIEEERKFQEEYTNNPLEEFSNLYYYQSQHHPTSTQIADPFVTQTHHYLNMLTQDLVYRQL